VRRVESGWTGAKDGEVDGQSTIIVSGRQWVGWRYNNIHLQSLVEISERIERTCPRMSTMRLRTTQCRTGTCCSERRGSCPVKSPPSTVNIRDWTVSLSIVRFCAVETKAAKSQPTLNKSPSRGLIRWPRRYDESSDCHKYRDFWTWNCWELWALISHKCDTDFRDDGQSWREHKEREFACGRGRVCNNVSTLLSDCRRN